jgi:hypothetical protein
MIPEIERYPAPFTPPTESERSVEPGGRDTMVNPVNQAGTTRFTGIPVSPTFPVFVRVIVYSKTSRMSPSPPFISTTLIVSSRRAILRINDVVLLASI